MTLTIKQEPKPLLLLTISLAARTHLVKMNTYPKLLYLLQSLHVLIPQAFLENLTFILKFIYISIIFVGITVLDLSHI